MKSMLTTPVGAESLVDASGFANLSRREAQVLQLAAGGLRDKEIRAILGVSLNTLRHRARIRGKVGEVPRISLAMAFVENRPGAMASGASVDWEIDLGRNTIINLTPDPNAPEVPVSVERTLDAAIAALHPDDASAIRTAIQRAMDGSLSTFAFTARRYTSRGLVLDSAFVRVIRN